MNPIDLSHLNQWLGNQKRYDATFSVEQANLMNATLSRETSFQKGDQLPPGWHWLYFHEGVPGKDLAADGHAKLGDFLPPVPLQRRMWAGGKIVFEHPILLGQRGQKCSTVQAITHKQGRTGPLCFVVIEHDILVEGIRYIREEQTLVYRDRPTTERRGQHLNQDAPKADFTVTCTPDPVLLFRYSALTFNSHRIHYDLAYCRQQEGYPNLVVHGPLSATLLLGLLTQRSDRAIASFTYRNVSPLFNGNQFYVHGRFDGMGWVTNHAGRLALRATTTWK